MKTKYAALLQSAVTASVAACTAPTVVPPPVAEPLAPSTKANLSGPAPRALRKKASMGKEAVKAAKAARDENTL